MQQGCRATKQQRQTRSRNGSTPDPDAARENSEGSICNCSSGGRPALVSRGQAEEQQSSSTRDSHRSEMPVEAFEVQPFGESPLLGAGEGGRVGTYQAPHQGHTSSGGTQGTGAPGGTVGFPPELADLMCFQSAGSGIRARPRCDSIQAIYCHVIESVCVNHSGPFTHGFKHAI